MLFKPDHFFSLKEEAELRLRYLCQESRQARQIDSCSLTLTPWPGGTSSSVMPLWREAGGCPSAWQSNALGTCPHATCLTRCYLVTINSPSSVASPDYAMTISQKDFPALSVALLSTSKASPREAESFSDKLICPSKSRLSPAVAVLSDPGGSMGCW